MLATSISSICPGAHHADRPGGCQGGRAASTEAELVQGGVGEAEEVPGLVQQGGADLLAQLLLVARGALEVATEQEDLRQPRLAAEPVAPSL